MKQTTQNNAPLVHFEPGFASTNPDPCAKHKLYKISRNIRYQNKQGQEVCLDVFIVSFAEQEEHQLELFAAKIENVFRK